MSSPNKHSMVNFILMAVAAFTEFGFSSSAQAVKGSLYGWGGANNFGQINVPAGENYVAIEAGSDHSLALKDDGSIISWGNDSTPPAGNDFVAIAAGHAYSLALKDDGSIVGWGGWSAHGASTPPEGNGFVAITAGYAHALALKDDGSIVGWGLNNFGQSTPPKGNDFVAVDTGFYFSVALRADGSIAAWGDNRYGQSTPPEGNDFVAISAGRNHCLAIKKDGSVIGWGRKRYGRIKTPKGNDFVAISAGDFSSIALRADGSIVAWGGSYWSIDAPPVQADGKVYVAIAGEKNHFLAIVADLQPATPTVDEAIALIEGGIAPEIQAIIDELSSGEADKFQLALNKLDRVTLELGEGELSVALKKTAGAMRNLEGAMQDGYDTVSLQLEMMNLAIMVVSIGATETNNCF